jgi:hypothetical protein
MTNANPFDDAVEPAPAATPRIPTRVAKPAATSKRNKPAQAAKILSAGLTSTAVISIVTAMGWQSAMVAKEKAEAAQAATPVTSTATTPLIDPATGAQILTPNDATQAPMMVMPDGTVVPATDPAMIAAATAATIAPIAAPAIAVAPGGTVATAAAPVATTPAPVITAPPAPVTTAPPAPTTTRPPVTVPPTTTTTKASGA